MNARIRIRTLLGCKECRLNACLDAHSLDAHGPGFDQAKLFSSCAGQRLPLIKYLAGVPGGPAIFKGFKLAGSGDVGSCCSGHRPPLIQYLPGAPNGPAIAKGLKLANQGLKSFSDVE